MAASVRSGNRPSGHYLCLNGYIQRGGGLVGNKQAGLVEKARAIIISALPPLIWWGYCFRRISGKESAPHGTTQESFPGFSFVIFVWAIIASATCAPSRPLWGSREKGSWKIMEILPPRISRMSRMGIGGGHGLPVQPSGGYLPGRAGDQAQEG